MNDQPGSSAHNVVTDNGLRTSTLVGPLDADCCNEDLAIDPTTGNVWRMEFIEGPLSSIVQHPPCPDMALSCQLYSL